MKNKYEAEEVFNSDKLIVKNVEKDSIAEELGVLPGDTILSINNNDHPDFLDFLFLTSNDYYTLEIQRDKSEILEFEIEKFPEEKLGIILDEKRKIKECDNNCIFCFIDQMPEGLRESLYIKDDDTEQSLLNGNYITLTNLNENDFNKILNYKIPINISVHTTNRNLRRKMLINEKAGNIMEQLTLLNKNNIPMNIQIVLVPDFNDKDLIQTLNDLKGFADSINSISVVPVGLTKYRKGLVKLRLFKPDESQKIVDEIENFQNQCLKTIGRRLVFASDEFYITANKEIPEKESYEDYLQLENGVGMVRDFIESFRNELKNKDIKADYKNRLIITGELFNPFLEQVINEFKKEFPYTKIETIGIKNNFFGESITVAGLITGTDIINKLKNLDLNQYDEILLPETMLKNNTELFLDNLSLTDLKEQYNIPLKSIDPNGRSLYFELCGVKEDQLPTT